MKLNVKAFALTCGLLWGLTVSANLVDYRLRWRDR